MPRNRRAGVEDRWNKIVRDEQGNRQTVPSVNHGKGSRWRARYVDGQGREHAKGFGRKADAQNWLNQQVSDQVTGTWTDPAMSAITFGVMALAVHQGHPVGQDGCRITLATGHRGTATLERHPIAGCSV
jgi:hypothetical protein